MTADDISCPSTYSPGRAVVMTTSLASSVGAVERQVNALPPDPSWRTVEALLVQVEQIFERLRAAGADVSDLEATAEAARHALSSADVSLATESLKGVVSRISAL
jgi:hypothetical protein